MSDDLMHCLCAVCGWQGAAEETADDGAAWPVVCPLCGSDELVYASDPFDGGAAS